MTNEAVSPFRNLAHAIKLSLSSVRFLVVCSVLIALACLAAPSVMAKTAKTAKKPEAEKLPVSGASKSTKLDSLDQAMLKFMQKHHVTAGQLAVSQNGQILYSKGFGFSDKEHKTPTTATNLFRIASVSKPITAVTILSLMEQGKLRLDEKIADILKDLKPPEGEPFDKRIGLITVRQLLEHTSGFSSNKDGDPQFSLLRLAPHKYNLPMPASAESVVRYVFAQPLHGDPGTKYEYSNFGYNVLGRIIEHKTGQPYEDYVKKNILAPAGVTRMMIGKVRLKDRQPDEVYYDDGGLGGEGWSIYPDELETVPVSYGSLYTMEVMDSHGGWIASAADLVKFCAAADGSNPQSQLLKPHTVEIMVEPPEVQASGKSTTYYAKGWSVNPKTGVWGHSGALTWGVSSNLFHLADGVQVACVFNHLPAPIGKYYVEMANVILPIVRRCHGEF